MCERTLCGFSKTFTFISTESNGTGNEVVCRKVVTDKARMLLEHISCVPSMFSAFRDEIKRSRRIG